MTIRKFKDISYIRVPIYNDWVGLVHNLPQTEAEKVIRRHFPTKDDAGIPKKGSAGYALKWVEINGGSTKYLIHITKFDRRKAADIAILAHECLHVTNYIMESVGIQRSDQTEEAYCYLHQFLVESCLVVMEK